MTKEMKINSTMEMVDAVVNLKVAFLNADRRVAESDIHAVATSRQLLKDLTATRATLRRMIESFIDGK